MKIENTSYSELLLNLSQGDQKAFADIYNLFYPGLLEHVNKKVRDDSAAEDILHDLFMSLWKTRGKISDIQSLPAYLYTSCRYLIINHIKKSSLSESLSEQDHHEMNANEQPLEERLYYRYFLDIVNKEIENLPEKCRQIFKLSRQEYKSNREIAEYLEISESTVENHIYKALKKLKSATGHLSQFHHLL